MTLHVFGQVILLHMHQKQVLKKEYQAAVALANFIGHKLTDARDNPRHDILVKRTQVCLALSALS
jgi:hypothetical protein